ATHADAKSASASKMPMTRYRFTNIMVPLLFPMDIAELNSQPRSGAPGPTSTDHVIVLSTPSRGLDPAHSAV
ncbi:MAG: hypothetical protein OXI52_03405, partial [Caldilineaceae bacterium]|nr:hypothetical protein [Caldilineaceae bacterium]